jgi:hypothetical protein
VSHYTDVIIARKSNRFYEPGVVTLPPDEDSTWASPEADPNFALRFAQVQSVMSCEKDIPLARVEFCLGNYAPFDLNATLIAGSTEQPIQISRGTGKEVFSVPVKDWKGKITVASQIWRPSEALGTADMRCLGVAVHSIRLVEEQ